MRLKRLVFLGGGIDLEKASNENVTSAAHRIVETPDLSTKLKKKHLKFKSLKFQVQSL